MVEGRGGVDVAVLEGAWPCWGRGRERCTYKVRGSCVTGSGAPQSSPSYRTVHMDRSSPAAASGEQGVHPNIS